MQGVLGAIVKRAESRPDGYVSTPIVIADQPKRCRRHLPKSIDRSLDTHFALSISRTVSPLAFLYTFIGRKGACDLFLNVDGGAEVVYGERPASCEKDVQQLLLGFSIDTEVIDRVEQHRQHLAPQVIKWKAYEAKAAAFQDCKAKFLQQQADSLTQAIDQKANKTGRISQKLASAKQKACNQHQRLRDATEDLDLAVQCFAEGNKQTSMLAKQVDAAQVKFAKAHVHHAAALQAAKQQAQAGTTRQKRLKTLQEQQAKARDALSATKKATKEVQSEATSLQQQLHDLHQEEDVASACGLIKQVKTLQARSDQARNKVADMEDKVSVHTARLVACQEELLGLQDQEHRQQAETAALHERLTLLQTALTDKCARQQSLQTAHMHAQISLQSLSEQLQAAAHPDRLEHPAGSPKLDNAVALLLKQSQQGQLQGTFFGRLQSLAVVSAPEDEVAVNAVLRELCSLANCLVVSDRQTAAEVVSHFKEHKVGTANCKIIAELSKHDRMGAMLNAEEGVRPLIALVQVEVPQAQCVFTSMLNSWYLVKDRHTAVRMIARDRKKLDSSRFTGRNLVTKQVSEVTASLCDLQQQRADLEMQLRQTSITPPHRRRMAGRDVAKRQFELTDKAQMVKELDATRNVLARQKKEAEHHAAKLQDEYTHVMAAARDEGPGGPLLDLQSKLAAHQTRCIAAAEAQQKADKAEKAASRRLALQRTSLASVSSDLATEAAVQGAKTVQIQQQVAQLEAYLQDASAEQKAASDHLNSCKTQLSHCKRVYDAAADKAKELQVELEQVQESLQADRVKKRSISQVLAAMQCHAAHQPAHLPCNGSSAAASSGGPKRQKSLASSSGLTHRRSCVILSDSESDTDVEERFCQPAAPFPRGPSLGRSAKGGPQKAVDIATDWESEAAELALEEASLEEMKAGIDVHALEEDVEAALRLQDLTQQLCHQEASLTRLQQEKQELEEQRLRKFCVVMKAVNGSLGDIYQKLTAGQGDAYLTYTEDTLLLFAEGVHFHVRPDAHHSRPFGSLSGGQQALATLALSFALQAAFPSPFYFFDEIDSALDTSNASRVADYIASQHGAQYLVVSHKPQVYERAPCLVGVYTCQGSSTAVTLHVPQ
ncbi:MAG: Structural maintenance of chromosomes 4 [Trebouxia sp. A1-2]|nr:MAG: Structural maintenance of chromosomes 4 [Trebouxia sp. A1-2]